MEAFFTESCESFIPLSSGANGAGGGRGGSVVGGGGAVDSGGIGAGAGINGVSGGSFDGTGLVGTGTDGVTVTDGVIGAVGRDPTMGSAGTTGPVPAAFSGFCGRATVGMGFEITGCAGGPPVDWGKALGCSLTAPVTFICGNMTLGAGASGLCW